MKSVFSFGHKFDIYPTYNRKDIDVLHQIEEECFSSELSLDRKSYIHDLKKAEKDGLLLVAKMGDFIVGSLFAEEMGGEGYISNVAVRSVYRGHGVAGKMLWLIEGMMQQKGYKESHLEVDTRNSALRLYLKSQYQIDRMIMDYYSKGQHALYMIKKL